MWENKLNWETTPKTSLKSQFHNNNKNAFYSSPKKFLTSPSHSCLLLLYHQIINVSVADTVTAFSGLFLFDNFHWHYKLIFNEEIKVERWRKGRNNGSSNNIVEEIPIFRVDGEWRKSEYKYFGMCDGKEASKNVKGLKGTQNKSTDKREGKLMLISTAMYEFWLYIQIHKSHIS